jgi:hypothetical protein
MMPYYTPAAHKVFAKKRPFSRKKSVCAIFFSFSRRARTELYHFSASEKAPPAARAFSRVFHFGIVTFSTK